MAAIYSNGGNRWNILGFNFNKRDALSSAYKISMEIPRFSLNPLFKKASLPWRDLTIPKISSPEQYSIVCWLVSVEILPGKNVFRLRTKIDLLHGGH
jgi:hypothetical protein